MKEKISRSGIIQPGQLTVNEVIWRCHHQLVVYEKGKTDFTNPIFGSCFLLRYREHCFLVTADHVIHYDDHLSEKQHEKRSEQEYEYFLVNNIRCRNSEGEPGNMMTSLYGFHFEDIFKYGEMSEFTEQELKECGATVWDFVEKHDVAFMCIDNGLPIPCIHDELKSSSGQILSPANAPSLSVTPDSISMEVPSENDEFYIYGYVNNRISGGIRFDRDVALHGHLHFSSLNDGLYKLYSERKVVKEEWEALSGSAVFNQNGLVVGMAVRIFEDDDVVWVMPIKSILEMIDRVIDTGHI